jgi:hypothetical protein
MASSMSHEAREMRNDIRQTGQYHSTQRREFIMWPVSYTGIKIIQDQMIEEALEHYAFLRGKKRKSEVCSRPLVRFWLVSPTSLLGNQKRPFLAVTGKWKERFPEP